MSFVFLYSCECGCGRDILDFNVATGGMATPTVRIDTKNILRTIDRIRWLEQALFWERERIRPHDLSSLLSSQVPRIAKPFCSPNCRSCLNGNAQCGFIDLSCWTVNKLEGRMRLEVTTLTTTGGVGYTFWDDVCGFPHDVKSPQRKLCFRGDIGYKVQTNQVDLNSRFDLLWSVRLLVQEGASKKIRLDGALGVVYSEKNKQPDVFRKAVYLEDRGLLYRKFRLSPTGQGQVELLAHNGMYCCDFSITIRDSSLLKKGRCLLNGQRHQSTQRCEKGHATSGDTSSQKEIQWSN